MPGQGKWIPTSLFIDQPPSAVWLMFTDVIRIAIPWVYRLGTIKPNRQTFFQEKEFTLF